MYWLAAILILPYLIILFRIYAGLLKIKHFTPSSLPEIFVSIVVACRNEQENLPHLLKSISYQDYPKGLFEVIIIDDNSADKTAEISSAFKETIDIITVRNNGNGKKQALRTGIGLAKGRLIVTTDADCRMGKKWLSTIVQFYSEQKPDLIICPVQLESMPGFFGLFQELEFLSLQGITAGTASLNQGTMCNGANLAFTRDAYFDNAGNLHFEIATGDDVFLLHSLKRQANTKISWLESHDAIVTTSAAPDTGAFFRQRRRWISKSKAYDDSFSILLGVITFLAVLIQTVLIIAAITDRSLSGLFILVFAVKSIPDFLILWNTASRYGKRKLMSWFLPAELLYPFYVFGVLIYSMVSPQAQEH